LEAEIFQMNIDGGRVIFSRIFGAKGGHNCGYFPTYFLVYLGVAVVRETTSAESTFAFSKTYTGPNVSDKINIA